MAGFRYNQVNQIIVHTGDAGVIEHMFDVDFILASDDGISSGTIHTDGSMDSPEEMVRREMNVITLVGVPVAGPAGGAALEPDARMVIYLVFIIYHRTAQMLVAHQVGTGEKRLVILGQQNDAEILETALICLSILNLIQRPRIGTFRGIATDGSQAVLGFHIELDNRPRGLGGDQGGV
ncbi:MAG: hypothetical protein BWY71_01869 [Planctomycetes bacterium ADurb.Bin412]|nr:MAG: hypothetical protein BWY71_01869 [Planctomycetes bacterium ADurb.Bin412]